VEGIPVTKRLDVAQHYVLGRPYGDIEEKTGVSHGSIANIIKELETGKLVIPGLPPDQVNDLRQLSFDLKKKGLEPSQALLGVIFFERLKELGISPADVEHWSQLVKAFTPADFPAKGFFDSAVRLHELEKSEGKPFEELAEQYRTFSERAKGLEAQIDSLEKRRIELSQEVQSLSSQVVVLEKKTQDVQGDVDIEATELQELNSLVKEAREQKAQLDKETEELNRRMAGLRSEVDGKEESLRRLSTLHFSDEDLLCLWSLLEKMANKQVTDIADVKDGFFRALDYFGSLSELQRAAEEEAETVKRMKEGESLLTGELVELENRKTVLEGKIYESVSIASREIRDASKEAVSEIKQEADIIKEQLKALLADALLAGRAVGEMKAKERKGEESFTELENLLGEVKNRVEGH
jgi:chromosome segregation ATPase